MKSRLKKSVNTFAVHLLTAGIRFYRAAVSPFLGSHCRFYPSCSAYAEKAFEKKGAARGFLLSAGRLLKCHPFHPGGIDDLE